MNPRFFGSLALATVSGMAANLTHGQIIQHQGAADPLSEGFTVSFSGDAQLGPTVGDQDHDAWSIDLNDGRDVAIYKYFLSTPEQLVAATHGWELSLTLRVVDGSAGGARFYTGSSLFSLSFFAETDGDLVIEAGPGASAPGVFYTVEGIGTSYHQYRLIYDSGVSTADLWVDGVERISDLTGISLVTQPRFDWGAGQSIGSAHWSEASLTVVPEPSTVVLLAFGGSVLGLQLAYRRGIVNRPRDCR